MLSVKMEITPEVERVLSEVKGDIEGEFDKRLWETVRLAKRRAPVDRGLLRASLTKGRRKTQEFGWRLWVGSKVHYSPWMEFGRRPGKMPPVSALEVWARRHGNLNPYVVARAIGRKGIKPRKFIRSAIKDIWR